MRRRMLMGAAPSTYLYNHGDECTHITGGWVRAGQNFSINGPPAFSKEADHLLLDEMNARGCVSIAVGNKIDLSAYRKIVIDCTAESLTQDGWIVFLIGSKVTDGGAGHTLEHCYGDYRRLTYFTNTSFSGKLEFDISDLTEGYPAFQCSNWKQSAPQRLRVYSVELVR